MLEHFYAVIMAGGGGTRLWPLSNRAQPKQMLHLGSDRSLFQLAVDRLEGVFPAERIFVVTVAEQARKLREQCPEIPEKNFLNEPMPRGTASVVGLAAVALQQLDPQASMAVLTADHFIENIEDFHRLLEGAYDLAQQGHLVTLGIQPTHASTGYGYIQRGDALGSMHDHQAYKVVRFKEKPDQATAEELVARGDHDWNSGMFIWRVDRILDEFHRLMPELSITLDRIAGAWHTPEKDNIIEETWVDIKPETIDYGIMEKAGQVAVLSAHNLGWNDVGSWDSLFDVLPTDEHGNIVLRAQHIPVEGGNSLVVSDTDRVIVTIGMNDIIVVDTGKALLICPRGESQQVRQAVNKLKELGMQDYL